MKTLGKAKKLAKAEAKLAKLKAKEVCMWDAPSALRRSSAVGVQGGDNLVAEKRTKKSESLITA